MKKYNYNPKSCNICGKIFVPENANQKYCDIECRKESMRSPAREASKTKNEQIKEVLKTKSIRIKKPKLSIGEISVLARQAGMTYGQYVAQMEGMK